MMEIGSLQKQVCDGCCMAEAFSVGIAPGLSLMLNNSNTIELSANSPSHVLQGIAHPADLPPPFGAQSQTARHGGDDLRP